MLQIVDDKPEENITVYGGQEHELHEPSGILRQVVGVNKDPHAKLGEFCDLKEAGFAFSGCTASVKSPGMFARAAQYSSSTAMIVLLSQAH